MRYCNAGVYLGSAELVGRSMGEEILGLTVRRISTGTVYETNKYRAASMSLKTSWIICILVRHFLKLRGIWIPNAVKV
jgi:hypothetical protein